MHEEIFEIGDNVTVINTAPLKGNDIAPPFENDKYKVINICLDSKGNQHLDLGLVSKYNYITSYETGERLPNGDKIHWVHPSRVVKMG